MLTFASKKLLTGTNGQKAEAEFPFCARSFDRAVGCLPRLTEYVTNFSLALGGLIGGNRRVRVVYLCRLNLLVSGQSSSLSSSSGSTFMLFLNQSRRLSIVNRQQSKGNEVHEALGRTPAKQLWVLTGNLKHRTFRVSVSQSGPQPARSTQPVQLSAAYLRLSCVNKAFRHLKRI